jgi:hypothetical protein
VANTFEAKRTGDKFLPLPGPFALKRGEIPRGGSFMRVTDIVPGDVTVEAAQFQPVIGTTGVMEQRVPTVTSLNAKNVRVTSTLKNRIVGRYNKK